ncbi:hypothetical protein [Mucilaginibacter sp. KACC 22063]|uniref:hypothetical protein n=1 Tax=Mucilaginibacter sp. KACC 22063 TaxID=3025666 RepID=UPI002366FB8C|nr:hypothetical protein [Mucilaginibacter sp. KACC 22063]WDF56036.1 hypothetical protein PQ461_03045 [Mucilaginibacter sp. KACC 22063]
MKAIFKTLFKKIQPQHSALVNALSPFEMAALVSSSNPNQQPANYWWIDEK